MTTRSNGYVLVVEDDEMFAALTADQLKAAGFHCAVAGTVRDALAMATSAQAGLPDAIVADIHLPDGDHRELLAGLRAAGVRSSVILVTGSPSLETSLESMEMQVFGYLVKPVSPERLADTVTRACESSRLRGRLQDAEGRYRALVSQVSGLQALARPDATPRDLDESLAEYLALLLGVSGQALAEAVDVLQLLRSESVRTPLRHLSRHPEAEMYREAIAHSIQVLERTRHNFKSKELAELRQRLEAALLSTARPRTV